MSHKILLFLAPMIFKVLGVLLRSTCRVRWHNKDVFDEYFDSEQPLVISFWHENVLIVPWLLPNRNVTCMVSDSRDGEYIARCSQIFGNRVLRGSSSKGSARATRAALRLLKSNQPIALTPDGPRGPAHKLQPGVLWLGALANAPVMPLHIEADRQWRFKSWDGQKLPYPFSTIHVGVSKPYHVERDVLNQAPATAISEFEEKMMQNTNQLRKAAGYPVI